MFKVAYVLELDFLSHGGVARKVEAQVRDLVSQGCECQIFVISPVKFEDKTKHVINTYEIKTSNSFLGQILRYINRISCAKKLKAKLREYNPDVIYYREGVFFPGLISSLGSNKVVVEVNHILGATEGAKSVFLEKLMAKLRHRVLHHCSGYVAISSEVDKSLKRFMDKPGVVISNGIDIVREPVTADSKDRINFLMVGSPNQPWQGFDELIDFARLVQSSEPSFHFYIAGPNDDDLEDVPNNVTVLGYMNPSQLDELMPSINICIGALASYRKNVHEASSLKHRLYASYRKCFIASVYDTDLTGAEGVLTLDNKAGCLVNNVDVVCEFAHKYRYFDLKLSDIEPIKEKEKSRLRFNFLKDIIATK